MRSRRTFTLVGIAVALALFAVLAVLSNRWADNRARARTLETAHQAAVLRAGLLNSELQKFQLLPVVLPEYPDVGNALERPDKAIIARLNVTLSSLAARTDASAIYLIDRSGKTVAASNWDQADSFIGQNYGFRPYFRQAMDRGSAQLFALGTVSGRAGLYISRRVERDGTPLGVLVVKVEFRSLEHSWASQPGLTVVADDHGVVIITSRESWHFRSLSPLSATARTQIRNSRQFGRGPGPPLGIDPQPGATTMIDGDPYLAATIAVPLLHAKLINLQPLAAEQRASHALARLVLAIVFAVALVLFGLVIRARERRAMQRAAHEALERQVALRTRELTEANSQLRAESHERELADARYRRAREELAQANRLGSIGQITAGVAHEINQPVAAIRTFAENTATYLDRGAGEKARGNIGTIISLTDRIGAITAELRSFARRGTPAIGAVELRAVIEGTLLLIGDAIRANNIRLEQQGTDSEVEVVADRVRLEQILVNLIQNAIHALDGADDPVIRISVGEASVTVADNGPGIDPKLAREIFTPFVTSKPHGLGLGLGIARDIAREFGGELAMVPSPLGGAAFELRLKRA